MHVITKRLSRLSKDDKDKFFQELGISVNRINRIRKLPAKERIFEAAKAALEIDPAPNSDFIEWLAGYSWRGALYHHYESIDSLLGAINTKNVSSHKRPDIISTKDSQIDILKFVPEKIKDSRVWIDSDATSLYVWQKVGIRVRSVKLNRIIDRNLFLIGTALYAGEGSKTPSDTRKVEIVNTSPVIIKIFIRFLEDIGIPKGCLKARIHAHSEEEARRGTAFWLKELNMRNKQFLKPLFKKSTSKSKKLAEKVPAIDIQYNNSMMRFLIIDWVNKLDSISQV